MNSKQSSLSARCRDPEMVICQLCGDSTTWSTIQESYLDEEGFIDIFDRVSFFSQGRSQCIEPDWTALILFDDRKHQPAIHLIEAMLINFEHLECRLCGRSVDMTGSPHLSVIATSSQQPVRDSRCTACAARNLQRALLVDLNIENLCRARDDDPEVFIRIKLEAQHDAKARAQWCREKAGPRCCCNEGKGLYVQSMGAR